MWFQSTRAQSPDDGQVLFEDCLIHGMALDGGLYYPAKLPHLTPHLVTKWSALKNDEDLYSTMVYDVISMFAGDAISPAVLQSIIKDASKSFKLPNWTRFMDLPKKKTGLYRVLELFHGPTWSFKDYSIMVLGGIINYFLKRKNRYGTVLVATSGDTGSAAIAGLCQQSNIRCAVLLPKERVSEVQQRMMTTVKSDSIKCILVDGNFDDCQRLMKEAFADRSFAESQNLMAVNSVNFGRIICQMVYYFWATLVHQPSVKSTFTVSVPTGNFGNILAAWYARKMGAPIDQLIIASNRNDILPRFHQSGQYKLAPVIPTITPSIDIALSSNFERVIQHYNRTRTADLYVQLSDRGSFEVDTHCLTAFRNDFCAISISEKETLETMTKIWREYDYVIDPHTAVGFAAAEKFTQNEDVKNILIVSTAHPAKFPEAVWKATSHEAMVMPDEIKGLFDEPENFVIILPTLDAVKNAVTEAFGPMMMSNV